MIGRVLAQRYRLVEFVAKGGMALVFRAVDERTGHDVAVKILRPEFNSDTEFLTRFQREATAASKMSHHNIVNLLDVGDENDCRYLVMEFVRGKTLKELIAEKGSLSPDTVGKITIRILSALQHAHNNGIIHRDIKPQNILVHSEGYIKVSDFGIARMTGAGTISKAENVMGSVHYFSPEQARGEDVTFASDLYSVGIVMYEMLTGNVPFDGDTPVAIALQQISVPPAPMSSVKPGIPNALEIIVARALEKDPAKRYRSAEEMAHDIQRALKEPEGDWLDRSQDEPIPSLSQITDRHMPVAAHAQGRHRFMKNLMVALLSVGVLAGLALGSMSIYNNVVNSTTMPYLIGETEEAAKRIAVRSGLKLDISRASDQTAARGTVILQSPEYETGMVRGETVFVTISTGPEQQPMPSVVGMPQEAARSELEQMGLTLLVVQRTLSSEPVGEVLTQSPEEGTMMDAGDIVQVTLSGGSVAVPPTVGMPREEALLAIQQTGLIVSEIREVIVSDPTQIGRVAAQLPEAGAQVMVGDAMTLAVYIATPLETPAATNGAGTVSP